MAKSVLIWGCGIDFTNHINSLKYQEMLGAIKIKAITSRDINVNSYCGIGFISKLDINPKDFDYVIVMSLNKNTQLNIKSEALEKGFEENRILMLNPFLDVHFDMEKYIKIKNNPPSILARNCWGVRCYERLGLEYTSPLINLYIKSDLDYLKLLKAPEQYLELSLQNAGMLYEPNDEKYQYPLCILGDIYLNCSHYKTFEDAFEKWETRKKRINWGNLFIMDYTKDIKHAEAFAQLPYKNKICFTDFEVDKTLENNGVFSVKSYYTDVNFSNKSFEFFIVQSAIGYHKLIDLFEFFSNGKISRILP